MKTERHYTHNEVVTISDPLVTIRDHYSVAYQRDKEDSPFESRLSLLRRAGLSLSHSGPQDFILDLGAGRQIVEKEAHMMSIHPESTFVTVDLAHIAKKGLLATTHQRTSHVRGSGTQLPFSDQSFSVGISNMALDFMPPDAMSEVFRVLKPGADFFVNLHHPDLIPENLDELIQNKHNSQRSAVVFSWWKYLRDNEILTLNPDEIVARFTNVGFTVERIEEVSSRTDTWWEVDAQKPKGGVYGGKKQR